jgi:hypothetical protein
MTEAGLSGLGLLAQESQHMSPTVLRADAVAQPLTIRSRSLSRTSAGAGRYSREVLFVRFDGCP